MKQQYFTYVSICMTLLCLVQSAKKEPILDLRLDKNTADNEQRLPPSCNPDMPNLSVGDVWLTDKSYDQFKKVNKLFILGLSDKQCKQCCTTESLLSQLQASFKSGLHQYKKKQIKIARADISQKLSFIEREGIRSDLLPSVLVHFDGEFYLYDGSKDSINELLHFINKIINPVVTLTDEDEIKNFLNFENEYEEKTKFLQKKPVKIGEVYKQRKTKTRVLAFIYEEEDYTDEIKDLKDTGRFCAKRDELRIGMVTDKKLIKKYKAKYGSWFADVTYTTMILKRYDGQIFNLDILNKSPQLTFMFWINKKSINPVEEMNGDTFRIFEMVRQPIMVAFVDFKNQNKKISQDSIMLVDEVLKDVAPAFYYGVVIAYADNDIYFKHRKLLGITHSRIPAISINNNEQRVVPYPQESEFTVDKITSWLNKFVKGQLESKDSGFGSIIDAEIKYMMQSTKYLTRSEFVSSVYDEGSDVLVFTYTSAIEDETQRMVAEKINGLAQKFDQMNINSVKFYSYDVNVENQPPKIENQEVPMIYFMPAYHKKPPYLRFLGQPKVSEMANFIKKHADIKFELTVNLEQQEQFQEIRMQQMADEYQRKQQMKMIEDELRKRGEL